jgi:hypothetical protein
MNWKDKFRILNMLRALYSRRASQPSKGIKPMRNFNEYVIQLVVAGLIVLIMLLILFILFVPNDPARRQESIDAICRSKWEGSPYKTRGLIGGQRCQVFKNGYWFPEETIRE